MVERWRYGALMADDGDTLKKFTIMLPRKIHQSLREEAYIRNMPISQIIIQALSMRIMLFDRTKKEGDQK
jgi:hypothetical protein